MTGAQLGAVAACSALVGFAVSSPTVIVGAPLAVVLYAHDRRRRARRRSRAGRVDALADFVDRLIARLKGGAALAPAIRACLGDAAGSVNADALVALRPVVAALDAGQPLGVALARTLERRERCDARATTGGGESAGDGGALVLEVLAVLVERGGPAVASLERLNDTLRTGQAVELDVATNAAQASSSAGALAAVPALFAFGVALIDPAIGRFYLAEPLGAVCVVVAMALSYLGWWWMGRLVDDRSTGTAPADHGVRPAVACPALVLIAVGPPLVAVAAVVVLVAPALRLRLGREARARAAATAALPRSLDVCAVVLGAGGTLPDSVRALAGHAPEPVGSAARRVLKRAGAGHRFDVALRRFRADLGPRLQPLTGVLILANEQGGSLGLLLGRLAADASAARRRAGEERARRLPVTLLAPLVTCSLPAVLIGAVAPVAIVALRKVDL